MSTFKAVLLASAVVFSGAVYATTVPEGTGHVDIATALPEGTGHVDIA